MLIPVNGIELSVTRHGRGDALVLLHGFTGSAGDWDGVVGALGTDREVVVLEHRGHGRSTNTGDAATYDFDQLVDDFAGAADLLELAEFDLLGHSMGGIVAMRYALDNPGRLRSLLLMDTGARGQRPHRRPRDDARRVRRRLDQGMLAVYDLIAPFLGAGDEGHQARERVRRSYEQMDVAAFTSLGEELLSYPSVLPRLTSLEVPTTVLVGEHDRGLRGASDDLAATIPGAVLEVIAGAAHSPQVEARDAWLQVVTDHLARRP